jgi:hypothetical protein
MDKWSVPRICIACHAKKLNEPVTAKDCLGFVEREYCEKTDNVTNKINKTTTIPAVHRNNDSLMEH